MPLAMEGRSRPITVTIYIEHAFISYRVSQHRTMIIVCLLGSTFWGGNLTDTPQLVSILAWRTMANSLQGSTTDELILPVTIMSFLIHDPLSRQVLRAGFASMC